MSKEYGDPEMGATELFPDFDQVFKNNLRKALTCGAVSERDMHEQPYSVYRAILVITAEAYGPSANNKSGLKMLNNLRHFI